LVLDTDSARFESIEAHIDPLQKIQGLEARDDDRDFILLGDRLVLPVPHDRTNMTCCQKTLDEIVGGTQQSFHSGWYEDMRGQDGEVLDPQSICLEDRHGVGWSSGLEPDGEKHDFSVGVLLCQLYGIEWRVNHPYIGSGRLCTEKI
jgi:hypothetical protein